MFDLVLRRDRDASSQQAVEHLQNRVSALEVAPKPKPKDGWDRLQIIAGALTPVVLAVLAYVLTGKIELALKKRQLEVATVKEMQSLISEIVHADSGDKATAAAVGLAAYGSSAVAPLCNLLRSPQQPVVAGAIEGLRTIGAGDPEAVCKPMKEILANRTRIYSWENHQTAVEMIGQLRCKDGAAALREYQRFLQRGVDALKSAAAPTPQPDIAALDSLQKSVQNSLQSLQ